MDEPGPTDVLSFPMDELRAGAVADDVAGARCARRRRAVPRGRAPAGRGGRARHGAELHLLLTHGVLHLLGYDHAEPEEHEQMFGLQGELLERLATTPAAPSRLTGRT